MNTESLFVKGKGPILTEYLRTRKKLGDAVAGRGFSFEPGFMYDAQNDLEIDVKSQLSALNYQLLEQAIAQELKQSGLDYDLAFKNAMIAWEADKQALISAWDQELALAKKAVSDDEELLNILAIEVGRRAIDLMEAKTAIELEMEGYRKTLEELDGTTWEYEVQLAEAKIITARKKLEVIPYLEQLIAIERIILGKEQDLVVKEQEIAESASQIIAKETEILNKALDIIEKLQAISEKDSVLVSKDARIIAKNLAIVDAMRDIIEKKWDATRLDADIISERDAVNTVALDISRISEDIASQELSVLGLSADVLAQEKINAQGSLDVATQEANKILAQAGLISGQAAVASREAEITEKDALIIAKSLELAGKEILISESISQSTGIDTQIIAKTNEVAAIKLNESDILSQVAEHDAVISEHKQEVISKEQHLIGKYMTIADLESSIASKEGLIAAKTSEIAVKIDSLIAKQTEEIAEKSLVAEAITGELIPKQQEVADEKTLTLMPAIESLVETMSLYVTELSVQKVLYDEIAIIKGVTAATETEKIEKINELIVKKQSLFDALGVTLAVTQDLIAFKEESLSAAVSNLINALNEYGGQDGGALEQQINIKKSISDVRALIESLAENKVNGELEVDQAEVEYEISKNALAMAELSLETIKANNELTQINMSATNQTEFSTQWANTAQEIITERENTTNMVILSATREQMQKQNTKVASHTGVSNAQIYAIEREGNAEENKEEEMAAIAIDSKDVTAQLTHLLRQD